MAEIEFMTIGDNGTTLVDIDDLNNYLNTFFDKYNYTESPSDQQLIVESSRQYLMVTELRTSSSTSVGEARQIDPEEDAESPPSGQKLIVEKNFQCFKETEPNISVASVSTNVRKVRKAVPEEDKNEKYWPFRKKNNEATRRSREQNKKKLEKMFSKSEHLNKNLNDLKEKHEKLKKKYKRLVKRKKSTQTAISKIFEICNNDAMEDVG